MKSKIAWILIAIAVLGVAVFISLASYQDFRFKGPPAQKEFADGKNWLMVENMPYYAGDTDDSVVVPAGIVHDGASIPQVLHSALRKNARYSRPTIVHDYLYWSQSCTRQQTDNLLLIAMTETKVPAAQRWAIYKAVRLGGKKAWSGNAEDRKSRKPRMIPIEYRDLPNDDTWPQYREHLFAIGVRDPILAEPSASFCRHGDATNVPVASLTSQATRSEIEKVMAAP